MLARTHNVIAFASLVTVVSRSDYQDLGVITVLVCLIANTIGSLLPDIDQASNRLWDLLPGGNSIGRVLKNVLLSHRTLSHSLLGVFLVYKVFDWALPQVLNSSFVDSKLVFRSLLLGYVSHLMADGLTEEGLPLLFPLGVRFGFPPIRSWRMKTGKWFEKFIVFPGCVIYTLYVLATNGLIFWKVL